MKSARQTTLGKKTSLSGIGIHSGLPVTMKLSPAAANTGIVFAREDDDGRIVRMINAGFRAVTATELATVVGDDNGPILSSVEHTLAAFTGLGIDNALVSVDGPELPIMDGSAAPIATAIDEAGIKKLDKPKRYIKVLKSICVVAGDAIGELRPNRHGFHLDIQIDFNHAAIGTQNYAANITPQTFRRELARARTFGFIREVQKLWDAGFARGACFENTIVLNDKEVMNDEGLRFPDEFARHKALDALGDLSMAGAPILGTYRSVRGGHKLNHAVLYALMTDKTAWRMTP